MNHGPQMHGPVVILLLLAGVAFLVVRVFGLVAGKAGSRRSGSTEAPPSTPAPRRTAVVAEASTAAAAPDIRVLSVRDLTKRYGGTPAVDGVTFSLGPGTVTGFLGFNGAGKTTTLRLILGLAQPTAGEALVFGRHYADLSRPAVRVGAMLETGDFHPGRRGRDHLRVLATAAGLPATRVEEVLELVSLGDAAGRAVRTYSLGMRQRLGLAGALLGQPELLILDEPANGLDPSGMRWLRALLRSFAAGGGTVLLSSHVLAEVAQTVDRVLIVDRGHLVADTRLEELARDGQSLEDAYLDLTAGAGR